MVPGGEPGEEWEAAMDTDGARIGRVGNNERIVAHLATAHHRGSFQIRLHISPFNSA